MTLAELTEPIDLCLADGRLDPRAIGWSRRPLHRTNLRGGLRGWGRSKRWEYWGIVTPTHVLSVTISSLDNAAVHQLYVLDRASGREREVAPLVPLARGVSLSDERPPVSARARAGAMRLEVEDRDGGTRIRGSAADRRGGVEIDAFSPDEGECLAVVVPWSERRFQYTVKHVARRVRGSFAVDGERHEIPEDGSWAVLDRGRGRWPYRITWNWGAGSGIVDGRRIGLQLGGKWTAGTGSSECALFVDGRASYLGGEPEWSYDLADPTSTWRVRGDRVDATLTPFHVRRSDANVVVVASRIRQAFGTWRGLAIDDAGERIRLDGLVGWAEEARNRW